MDSKSNRQKKKKTNVWRVRCGVHSSDSSCLLLEFVVIPLAIHRVIKGYALTNANQSQRHRNDTKEKNESFPLDHPHFEIEIQCNTYQKKAKKKNFYK